MVEEQDNNLANSGEAVSNNPGDASASQPEEPSAKPNVDASAQSVNIPPWIKRIGKMMVIFAILGCILLCIGAMLLNSVIENALSTHGL